MLSTVNILITAMMTYVQFNAEYGKLQRGRARFASFLVSLFRILGAKHNPLRLVSLFFAKN
jgi:hypothetical protein